MSTANSSVAEQKEGGQVATAPETKINPVNEILLARSRSATEISSGGDDGQSLEGDFNVMVSNPSALKAKADNPFDPARLRLDMGVLRAQAAKRLLITIPVRKPGKQDFIRVHPSPDYRM